MTVPTAEEQKLSGLALVDAYLNHNYKDYRNIIDNTPSYELHGGMVLLLVEVMGEYAACLGVPPLGVIELMRAELLQAQL
jgi:hypothetical protein